MICQEKLEGKLRLQDLWSGVAGCQIWARKVGKEKQLLKGWQAETPLAQAELSFALKEEGEWTLWAEAWDAAGNHWEEEKSLGTVWIDATAPKVSLLVEGTEGEHGFYTGHVRLRLEAEDAGSGLEKIVLCADGEQRAAFSCDAQSRWQETAEVPDEE